MPGTGNNSNSNFISSAPKKWGYSKRNWFQELFGGDDPYVVNDDPITRLFGMYGSNDDDLRQELVNMIRRSDAGATVSGLSDSELLAILDENGYFDVTSNWFTGDNYSLDTERLFKDLEELSSSNVPIKPNVDSLYNASVEAINAENQQMYDRYNAQEARLDELLKSVTEDYRTDMQNLSDAYSGMRSNIMSSQHQRNAQLMDTLESQMSKTQRNAIEAGASAGLRIASNINTLLSVQNKMSQQSLETSNQLAQMLLNQKSAEQGLRNDYNNYMQQDANNRASIDRGRNSILTSTQGRVDSHFNNAYSRANESYNSNTVDWNRSYGDNPFADSYYNSRNKSHYNSGGT